MRKEGTWGPEKEAYDKNRYHDRRRKGLCPRCPRKPEPGKVYCEKCLERDKGRKR